MSYCNFFFFLVDVLPLEDTLVLMMLKNKYINRPLIEIFKPMPHDISVVRASYSFSNAFLTSFPIKLHLTQVKSDVVISNFV